MREIDILRISLKMLRTNLLRTLLTVLAISTAISLIVVLVGIGYGIQDITIGSIVRSQSLLSLDVAPGKDNSPALNQKVVDQFKTYPGIADVSPVYTAEAQVSYGGKLISNAMEAGREKLPGMEGVDIAQGRSYKDDANEVVLSPQAVTLLDLTPEEVLGKGISFAFVNGSTQQKITLDTPLTVVGISTDSNPVIFLPYSLVEHQLGVEMSAIKAVAKDRQGVVDGQDAIRSKGYVVSSLLDTLDSAKRVFRWITFGLVVIAVIALVVAAIGMFNTLTIALLERTREIGIMKAIGVTDSAVKRLFLTESAVIGFSGGFVGIVFGMLGAIILNVLDNQIAIHYGGEAIKVIRYPDFFLLSMLLYPLLLSVVTGFYPATRAAKISSLAALRYE